ncbi:hypothetical protein KM92DES2_12369 [uncultured Desulfovibrio sp.]|uniref:Uncharacterized protein n=1 Tax=uncultured Desulfovibrio sp. TaxID=167968 RepID=A0A212K7M2_9BACT|nr:hypothetical protein KM92DES2_12369 [uncultured Desulfovibrio sp.]
MQDRVPFRKADTLAACLYSG